MRGAHAEGQEYVQKVAFCVIQTIRRCCGRKRSENALLRSRDHSSDLKERLHQTFDRSISSPTHAFSLNDPSVDPAIHLEEVRLCSQRFRRVAEVRLGKDFVGTEKDAKGIEWKQRNGRGRRREGGKPIVAVEPVECLRKR